ncbi:uncharacterized protein FIBRA_07471 [Fibroporia radiculosa]|uniref:FAD-dependent oxidoreductase 2 FAD-binding domain-containing protein n=1 Tax=Fibroporia radiculosa TaxID=599839 RepID=J4IBU3_9APHY|nr:uncharacterized protein FIBRA_07471 [Fibroporia radiculosa]CCM05261.1 predicted protein [Fibroporia radiculosa]
MDSSPETVYYDVIIVGGGVAGCAAALTLFHSNPGASVLILDDADPGVFKIGESLPAAAKQILTYLSPDLLQRLSGDGHERAYIKCTGNASAWGSSELEETHAMMNPFGMGWHLDRACFDQILRDTVSSAAPDTISLVKGVFMSVDTRDDALHWSLSASIFESDKTRVFTSKWVVDASGRKATVARKLGARTIREDALLAFYAVFVSPPTTEDQDFRTVIEASESGWWYSSPLPSNRRVVAYHTDDSNPTSRDARKQDGFINLLHTNTQHISQLITSGGYDILVHGDAKYPVCTAAGSARLEPPCGVSVSSEAKWIAVGDAAMAFDPLSSQGMITALKMGCFVGDVIARDLLAAGSDDPTSIFQKVYSQAWSKYDEEKQYFYAQEKRFDGEFWRARK